jgi:hypothetical protein
MMKNVIYAACEGAVAAVLHLSLRACGGLNSETLMTHDVI